MGSIFIPALVLGVTWMIVTSRLTVESFLVGVIIGLAIMAVLRPNLPHLHWSRLPEQLFAAVVYLLVLLHDITLSGLDVARRVLSPTMPLSLGIIAVDTQDEASSPVIAALSADVITLTPGELVVEVHDNRTLYVHCLDVNASSQNAQRQQAQRVRLFKRILGRSS